MLPACGQAQCWRHAQLQVRDFSSSAALQTTLLNHILKEQHDKRIMVIENEVSCCLAKPCKLAPPSQS